MLKIRICIILLLFSFFKSEGQDLIFSQFHAVPGQINPALIGTANAPRITAGYRNRAPLWPNAFVSQVLYYDQFIDRINSGIGVGVTRDAHGEGVWQLYAVQAFYVYQANFSKDFGLRIGVEGGIRQEILDYDRLVFFDQLHPETGVVWPNGQMVASSEIAPVGNRITKADFGAGISLFTKRFYLGFSAKHLSSPDFNFLQVNDLVDYGLDIRLSAQMGFDIVLKESYQGQALSFISPYVLWVNQGGAGQFNAGVFGGKRKLYGGAWYRYAQSNSDAVIGMIGTRFGIVKLAYSYDFIISDLSNELTGGAHEITISINTADNENVSKRKREKRYNDCYRLFR